MHNNTFISLRAFYLRGIYIFLVGCAAEEPDFREEEPAVSEGYRVLVALHDPKKNMTVHVGGLLTDVLRVHRVSIYPKGDAPTADQVFGGYDEKPNYSGTYQQHLPRA